MTAAPEPIPDARPAHYRLSTETWAMILEEYKGGATAPALSAKWRVSQHAIRKRATQHGATKRDHGDAQARAGAAARAAAMEAALSAALLDTPEARARGLFAEPACEREAAGDAMAMAATAARGSGRAMREGLWAEAKALAALAESYRRLGEKVRADVELTAQTAPLPLVFDILTTGWWGLGGRFSVLVNERDEEEMALKRAFWREYRKHRDGEHMARMQWLYRDKPPGTVLPVYPPAATAPTEWAEDWDAEQRALQGEGVPAPVDEDAR